MERDLITPSTGSAPGVDGPGTKGKETAPEEAMSLSARGRSALGSLLLFLGIGLLGLLLIDPGELPLSMPRSWYIDRTLWVAGGLIALGGGWYLLRDDNNERASDQNARARAAARRPSQSSTERFGSPGPRFTRLVLYTRAGCHLCEEARAVLDRYSGYLPPITEVDIDKDPDLIGRFSTCVPVVELDGKVRFRGRVNELLLRRLIAATPPRDTTRRAEDL
jgi:glutaredoxin